MFEWREKIKTLDACVTPGFLPYALQAALRVFKIVPGDFVAGMTLKDKV
jgi:2-keto-3-deoxy-6-phosphogluconate aldolase